MVEIDDQQGDHFKRKGDCPDRHHKQTGDHLLSQGDHVTKCTRYTVRMIHVNIVC